MPTTVVVAVSCACAVIAKPVLPTYCEDTFDTFMISSGKSSSTMGSSSTKQWASRNLCCGSNSRFMPVSPQTSMTAATKYK